MSTTPAIPKPSAVSVFLGEAAAAPEAVVKVEVTGTPKQVQKAIQQIAKKNKKAGGAPLPKSDGPPIPAGEELPPAEGGEELPPEGGGEGGEGEGEPLINLDDEAADVVESLIQEGAPAAPAAQK